MSSWSPIIFSFFSFALIGYRLSISRQTKRNFEKSLYFITGHIDVMSSLRFDKNPTYELKTAQRQEARNEMRMQS